jgi:cysteamine dioxygenase
MFCLQHIFVFSWSFDAPTAAAGRTKLAGNPDNYAWLEATEVNVHMQTGMYTGPTVQV